MTHRNYSTREAQEADQDIHITQDDVIRFLKRGFWLAALAAVVAGGATFMYRRESPPVYEASTTLYAADNVVDLRSVGLSYLVSPALHVDAYEVAAHSEEVLSSALAEIGAFAPSRDDIESLRSRVWVETDEESRLIMVFAVSSDPVDAAGYSQAVAEALVVWDAQRPRDNLLRMIENLRQRIASLDAQFTGMDAGPQRDSLAALRDEQVSQLATAVMLSDSVVGRLEVVQPPAIPESPVAPSPVFDAVLAALVAFALAYLARLLVVVFDGRLRDPAQVPLITGLPVVAQFPSLKKTPGRFLPPVQTGFLRSALISPEDGGTAVLFAGMDSSSPASRLALGLAESMARAGSGTLLVSTVPRDQDVLDRMGVLPPEESTLEAHLRNPRGPLTPYHVRVDGPGVLAVLPSVGTASDVSELITFGLRDALERWRDEYDAIVIVTPAVLEVADAVTVAPVVDRTLLVADRRAKRRELASAAELLRSRAVAAVGVVITGAAAHPRSGRVRPIAPKPLKPVTSTRRPTTAK